MTPSLASENIFSYHVAYCNFKVLYDDCKWWQFHRKRLIKEQLDWVYPLMRSAVKAQMKFQESIETKKEHNL